MSPGTILELAKKDWRYGGHTLVLLVEFVRLDLSTYYDNEWVWITGQQLARDGSPLGHLDALVRVSALPGADRGPAGDPGTDLRPAARPRPVPRQRVQRNGRRHHHRDDHEPDRRGESPPERAAGDRAEHQAAQ